MYILNLNTRETIEDFRDKFYVAENSYLILSAPKNLKLLKETLDIDEITFNDCLKFDEITKLDLFDNYDFLSLNTFELRDGEAVIEEVNMYLSDNFILVVVNEEHFLFEFVKNIILKNSQLEKNPVINLFKINYLILRGVIKNGFESLEKVEELILQIEDEMMDNINKNHVSRISDVRGLTRIIVKNTRPLLYIGDRIVKENIRYLKYSNVKKYNLENFQGIDFGIDKLYNFALSTRELADKLLDIYSSRVGEKTNNLITKLTLLTAISAPLTIITGIYGMNFRYMPELNWIYGYPATLFFMLCIIFVGIIIFKIKKLL
ncbi:CorA family divalent cation transporter [Clostridioides difficile]|nr:CorA family divalent cation transporter [Clostridioides difficile]